MTEKNNINWKSEEWDKMREKLDKLSLEELRNLATQVGIEFEGGNENIADTKNLTAKEQFLLVLDEADKEELFREYKNIIESKK